MRSAILLLEDDFLPISTSSPLEVNRFAPSPGLHPTMSFPSLATLASRAILRDIDRHPIDEIPEECRDLIWEESKRRMDEYSCKMTTDLRRAPLRSNLRFQLPSGEGYLSHYLVEYMWCGNCFAIHDLHYRMAVIRDKKTFGIISKIQLRYHPYPGWAAVWRLEVTVGRREPIYLKVPPLHKKAYVNLIPKNGRFKIVSRRGKDGVYLNVRERTILG